MMIVTINSSCKVQKQSFIYYLLLSTAQNTFHRKSPVLLRVVEGETDKIISETSIIATRKLSFTYED